MAAVTVNDAYLQAVEKARTQLQDLSEQYAPAFLRIALHDALTWDTRGRTGGANGSIRQELHHSGKEGVKEPVEALEPGCIYVPQGNEGLEEAIEELEHVKAQCVPITFADLAQLAGVVGAESLGGPEIEFRPGRRDSRVSPPEGRLPAFQNCAGDPPALLKRLTAAGLSKRQAVALCGAHPLGRWWSAPAKYEELQPRLEGMSPRANRPPPAFDASIYREILDDQDPLSRHLGQDPECRIIMRGYVSDPARWLEDYAEAFQQVSEATTTLKPPRRKPQPGQSDSLSTLATASAVAVAAVAIGVGVWWAELPEKRQPGSAVGPADVDAAQHSVGHKAAQPPQESALSASSSPPNVTHSAQATGSSNKPAIAEPATAPPLLGNDVRQLPASLDGEAGGLGEGPAGSSCDTGGEPASGLGSNAAAEATAGGSQAAADGEPGGSVSKQAAVLCALGLSGQQYDPRIQGTVSLLTTMFQPAAIQVSLAENASQGTTDAPGAAPPASAAGTAGAAAAAASEASNGWGTWPAEQGPAAGQLLCDWLLGLPPSHPQPSQPAGGNSSSRGGTGAAATAGSRPSSTSSRSAAVAASGGSAAADGAPCEAGAAAGSGPVELAPTANGAAVAVGSTAELQQVVVIDDMLHDPRVQASPLLVQADPPLRFFAGVPLVAADGGRQRIGSLGLFDFQPRSFNPQQQAFLSHFAEVLAQQLQQAQQPQRAGTFVAGQGSVSLPAAVAAVDLDAAGGAAPSASTSATTGLAAVGSPLVGSEEEWRQAGGCDRGAPLLCFGIHPPLLASAAAGSAGEVWSEGGHPGVWQPQHKAEELQAAQPPPQEQQWELAQQQGHLGEPGAGEQQQQQQQPRPDTPKSSQENGPQQPQHPQQHPQPPPQQQQQDRAAPVPATVPPGSESGGGLSSPDEDGLERQLLLELLQKPLGAGSSAATTPSSTAAAMASREPSPPSSGPGAWEAPPLLSPQHSLQRQASSLPGGAAGYSRLSIDSSGVPSMASVGASSVLMMTPPPERDLAARLLSPGSGPPLGSAGPMAFTLKRPEGFEGVVLGAPVGRGGNGRCYRGLWMGGHVVVKIMDCLVDRQHLLSGPGMSTQALDSRDKGGLVECVLGRCLAHPHLVPTYDYGVSTLEAHPHLVPTYDYGVSTLEEGECYELPGGRVRQQVWIVQAYCNRGTLLEAIQRGELRGPSGSPNLLSVLRTAQEVAGALLCLHHNKVLHGDLTCNNILLSSSTKDSRRWVAQVADFGLSRVIESTAISTQTLGTITHMPPELLMEGLLSPATDVYSYGAALDALGSTSDPFRSPVLQPPELLMEGLLSPATDVYSFGPPELLMEGLLSPARMCTAMGQPWMPLDPLVIPSGSPVLQPPELLMEGLLSPATDVYSYGVVLDSLGSTCDSLSNSPVLQPPELLMEGLLSPATDVYSYGVVLWEMWSGGPIWKGMTVAQVLHAMTMQKVQLEPPADAPAELQASGAASFPNLPLDLIRQCLSRDHQQRPTFETILATLTSLLRVLSKGPQRPGGDATLARPSPPAVNGGSS
ncbi:hypothetical protein N2152v2_006646 [Parachlorella kessleri]